MNDSISRQRAINAVRKCSVVEVTPTYMLIDEAEVITELTLLPSAQPKIVRCKDCKWKQGSECVRFADVRPLPDDFCSRAERR